MVWWCWLCGVVGVDHVVWWVLAMWCGGCWSCVVGDGHVVWWVLTMCGRCWPCGVMGVGMCGGWWSCGLTGVGHVVWQVLTC